MFEDVIIEVEDIAAIVAVVEHVISNKKKK